MADTRRRSEQIDQTNEREYDSRLHLVGSLWPGTSSSSGRPIWTGEVSLGVTGMPMPILITENNRDDRSDRAPTHFIFIRIPRRAVTGTGNGNDTAKGDDGLAF